LEWVKEQPGMLEHLARFKAVAKPKIDELNKIELVEDELLKALRAVPRCLEWVSRRSGCPVWQM
jgi:hypothetical protein